MDTDDFKRIYENASAALTDPVGPYSFDEAIEPLSQMDAGDVDRLLRDLLTGDRETRRVAWGVLAWTDDRVVRQVAAAYMTSRRAPQREWLIVALRVWAEKNDRAFETIALALSDRSKHVRAAACEGLLYSLRPEAEPLLKVSARDEEPIVREAAKTALRELRVYFKEQAGEAALPERLRSFPRLTSTLREQLLGVPASYDPIAGGIRYRPCLVTLRDGSSRDHVYVQEVERYHLLWGVLPEDDSGKESVSLSDVVAISESPSRLPVSIANRIYAAGESGMGYCIFTLVFDDGSELPCLTGNAVDFVALPDHLDRKQVVDVRLGAPVGLAESEYASTLDYAWCLYADESKA